MVNISATLLEPLAPGCVFTAQSQIYEPVGPPSIAFLPPAAQSPCDNAASICMQHFAEAQSNISIVSQPSAFAMVPNITQEQFVETCQQSTTLRECFEERNVWTHCNGDERVKSLNQTLFTMCSDQYRQCKFLYNIIFCKRSLMRKRSF